VSGFATWLVAQRARRVLFIAGLFPLPLLGLASAAAVIMTAQVKGPRTAVLDCLIALALLGGLGLVSGMDVAMLLGSAAISWLVWLALGAAVALTGSLALGVQTAVLLALAAMSLLFLAIGDPVSYWVTVLEDLYAQLPEQDFGGGGDIEAQARLMNGVLLAGALTGGLIALLLGSAWASSVQNGNFAEQFKELRLGYVIGGLAALAGIAALLGWGPDGLLLIFGAAFMFHGLAVLTWWARQLGWPGGWWVGLCILPILLLEFLVVEATLLAAVGFIDNWFDLRRRPGRPA
jgi:hypothetical protein